MKDNPGVRLGITDVHLLAPRGHQAAWLLLFVIVRILCLIGGGGSCGRDGGGCG